MWLSYCGAGLGVKRREANMFYDQDAKPRRSHVNKRL